MRHGWTTGTPRGESGASAVEFALVASLLFMIIFGIIQFGISYNRYQGLHASAREAARLGSLPDTTRLDMENRVKNSVSIVNTANIAKTCSGALAVEKGCINVSRVSGASTAVLTADTDKPCSGSTSDRVIVEVRYRMRIDVLFVATFTPTVTGVGDFVCENGG